MYVQKKLMAKSKLEQEKFADIANLQKQQMQQQQIDAMKTFASLQQMNSAQQQQITALLAAAMMNKNFIFNQQSPQSQLTTSQEIKTSFKNQPKSNFSESNQVNSRKRSHSDIDAFSSSEEEPYSCAKLRQPPSLGKINTKSVGRNVVAKVDQNNNASSFQNTKNIQNSVNFESVKQYDSLSNHSDEEEPDGKKQNKRGRNYRKMMIEKRRRDRINNSLNELRRLVPAAFEKQGSAKLEKAEILQMTVDHLKQLHEKSSDTFALDCHKIGFRECANEVKRYLNNCEKIDEPVKQRVISHLQFYFNEREQLLLKETGQLPSNINLTNLKNFENEKLKNFTTTLPPSPPSSSVSPSALSTSSNTSQFSNISSLDNISNMNNIQTNKSQIYPPFALLKSKKLNYNNLTTNNYDKTLKTNEEKKNLESNDSKICRPWGQATLNAY